MNKQSLWYPLTWVPSLYFAEGLPYVAVNTLSLLLYKQLGLSMAQITFYTSWLYLPWVIKPLWGPFVELSRTKRWWILTMQMVIAAAFGGVAFTIPTDYWLQATLWCFWIMAFASSSHDIAADGFYMLGLSERQQSFYVGIRSTFYRLAIIFGSGILVMLVGNLQILNRGGISYSWSLVFYLCAGIFIALSLLHHFTLPRPAEDPNKGTISFIHLLLGIFHTFITFFRKPQWIAALAFMLFYRMPEGLLSKVASLFLVDQASNGGLGLSPMEYGLVQGTVGTIGLVAGGILGGVVVGMQGLKRWLWPMALAITLPDAVYVYLSYALPDNLLIINTCVFIEQFGYGFGFTAYMLFLLYYSRGEHQTAHYAYCTAFMTLSLMLPGLFAGELQELVGYRTFFIIVMVCCILTFVVSALIRLPESFGKRSAEEKQP